MIGEKLGSFRIDAILGTGAMGVVYRATSETTGKPAAVKVISGELSHKSKTYERFQREASILQQFRHSNIVRFLAVGRYKGTSYFAMEYVSGETLEQMLSSQGALSWPDVVDLSIQICNALHYAHEHGVVHRDLKPSNLMVSDKGQIKLTDFGIAKDLDATALTATGRTLGTAAYMAPEQIRGTPEVSHKTDLYALGIVIYQMLVGRAPFEGASAIVLMHAHINQPVPRPSAKVAEIPVALDKLVVQLMAKDPNDRPWDAAAVAHALTEIREKASRGETVAMVWPTDGNPVPAPATTHASSAAEVTKKSPKKSKGRRIPTLPELNRSVLEVCVLLLALVAIGGFLGYMLWPPSDAYLYKQAERLMGSKDFHDWRRAREEYIDELDHRNPNHAYREATKRWRDQIELNDAERRAEVLESPMLARFNDPQNRAEHEYRAYFQLAQKAKEKWDDQAAVGYWEELARALRDNDPVERPWAMLARARALKLKQEIAQRRERVVNELQRALEAGEAGRPTQAKTIRDSIKAQYGKYVDLDDVFVSYGLKSSPGSPPPPKEPSSETGTPGADPARQP